MDRRISLMMLIVCCLTAAFWTTVEAAPSLSAAASSNEFPSIINYRDFRSRRGFKNTGQLATARGFGKRSSFSAPSIDQQEVEDTDSDETYPMDWLVEYAQKKPTLVRYLLLRTFDRDGDGQVSSSEIIDAVRD